MGTDDLSGNNNNGNKNGKRKIERMDQWKIDVIKSFLDNCCQADKTNTRISITMLDLHEAFDIYCQKTKRRTLSKIVLGKCLQGEMGFTMSVDERSKRIFLGIKLKEVSND